MGGGGAGEEGGGEGQALVKMDHVFTKDTGRSSGSGTEG